MKDETKKNRKYQPSYLSYGFIAALHNHSMPFCLLCQKQFSNEAMKPSKLLDHLKRRHREYEDKPLDFFLNLKSAFEKRNTVSKMFTQCLQNLNKGLLSSYQIAQIIAKAGFPHSTGERIIKPAFEILLGTMLGQESTAVLNSIPLSNDTIRRRIDELSSDIEIQLVEKLKKKKFSVQIDESTVSDSRALLMVYCRYIDDDFQIAEEMCFLKYLETDTTGSSIYETFKSWMEVHKIPFYNIVSCATDGAPSMVGKHKGFISFLKKECPSILTIHCVIHRHNLVAKNLSPALHESLKTVVKVINRIKTNSKYDRLFQKFCKEKNELHIRLILHTEVRWLSKGNCLKRVVELFDTIIMFLNNEQDCELAEQIRKEKNNIFFMSWLFQKFNEISLQLQVKNNTLFECKRILKVFTEKIEFYRRKIEKKDFNAIPLLINLEITELDLINYNTYLYSLKEELSVRFADLFSFEFSSWMFDPFGSPLESAPDNLQEELIELRCDEEALYRFKKDKFYGLWLSETSKKKYPILWENFVVIILCFPSSYLVETGFSAVNKILTKERNKLDISKRGDIRLKLTKIEPNIEEIMENHQSQGSH